MDKYLSIQDMVSSFEEWNKQINRISILRYVRMGLAFSSLADIDIEAGDRKKYYHPVSLIEGLTALSLLHGDVVFPEYGEDGSKVYYFGTGRAVFSDVFTGRLAFLAKENTLAKLNKLFYFCDYPLYNLKFNFFNPDDGKSWGTVKDKLGTQDAMAALQFAADGNSILDELAGLDMSKKNKNGLCTKVRRVSIDENERRAVNKTDFDSGLVNSRIHHCTLGYPDPGNLDEKAAYCNKIISASELYESHCFVLREILKSDELVDSYVNYQRQIYEITFTTLAKAYLPYICRRFYGIEYLSPKV